MFGAMRRKFVERQTLKLAIPTPFRQTLLPSSHTFSII